MGLDNVSYCNGDHGDPSNKRVAMDTIRDARECRFLFLHMYTLQQGRILYTIAGTLRLAPDGWILTCR